jgi:DNA replication protein DnaC
MFDPIDFEQKRLERISQRDMRIPARLLLPYAQAIRLCEVCGAVEPRMVPGGYLPRECEHLREVRYANQDRMESERQQQKQASREAEEATPQACYRWLGEDYSEDGLELHTFERFVARTQNQAAAKAEALRFASDPSGNLIFHGGCGCGKTHLACAIAGKLLAKGIAVRFTTGPNLFNAIADRVGESHSYQDIIKRLCSATVLILDDIDKVPPNQFRQQVWFEVLNKRTNRKLPTILTTNVAIKQYATELKEVLGDAAASRLNVSLVLVGIRGEDYRQMMIRE